MDDAIDDLRRTFERVKDFQGFRPDQRVWWIYMRVAVERWLERNEDAQVRAAHDQIKAFPENLPDEAARWIALRNAVAAVIAQRT